MNVDVFQNGIVVKEEPLSPKESKECEYFHLVIRPMLSPGHEGELCEWMKQMGLLRSSVKCSNGQCDGRMVWSKARTVDKYNWACATCSKRVSIREGSFFMNIKGDIKGILQAILGWCEIIPVDTTVNNLDMKQHVVKKVYERCAEVAERYIHDHPQDWLLGGEGAVVVVDVYPDGYMTSTSSLSTSQNNNKQRILCIADTNHMPARIWVRVLEHNYHEKSGESRSGAVEEALTHVKEHVRPGSTIVANERAKCCSFESLSQLKDYPCVISVETLMELDLPGTRRLQENLETIWQSAVEVCEEVQDRPKREGNQVLYEFMWRQLFSASGTSGLENILHNIADQYPRKE